MTDCINKHVGKVSKGIFCIYDVVTQRDVRVEIQIPGGTHVYALTASGEEDISDIHEWNNTFMSSCLRAFHPVHTPVMRVVRELESPEAIKEFLEVAS